MNRKTLIGLAVAALIAIVIAVVVGHSNQPRSESAGEDSPYLVPALRDHVNDVDKVIVTGAENKPVATLTRGANGWSIAEKGGFAADTGKLREFLLKLADAKLIEQACVNVLKNGLRTADIMSVGTARVGTAVMGESILRELDKLAA